MSNLSTEEYFSKFDPAKPVVCIQGLGFVGAAMAAVASNAKDEAYKPCFNVIGIDLPNETGMTRINILNEGKFPFVTTDKELMAALSSPIALGNFFATSDNTYLKYADVVIVDINLDISYTDNPEYAKIDLDSFKNALVAIGCHIKPDALIIIETTVPPGTCEKIVKPILEEELKKRKLPADRLMIAHSYERVMPGNDYYNSIINYWRVFSGIGEKAQQACENFLAKIINVDKYPLTKLKSTRASETAKVLENSFRAVNIAFIEEWGRFAEDTGVDLFEVINAIRMRPTHANIRQPGFGVGGYCLTKDPLFAKLAARDLFGLEGHNFNYCTSAIKINNEMPLVSLNKILKHFGSIKNKRLLLLGVSYKQDVGDTRYSPSAIFMKAALEKGAVIDCYDPLVNYWDEFNLNLPKEIPSVDIYDIIMLTVGHSEFLTVKFANLLTKSKALIFDTNNVLKKEQIDILQKAACKIMFIGRGDFDG
jgi:nucleotide sugar dehydrogenase